jgi:hypothetical protein
MKIRPRQRKNEESEGFIREKNKEEKGKEEKKRSRSEYGLDGKVLLNSFVFFFCFVFLIFFSPFRNLQAEWKKLGSRRGKEGRGNFGDGWDVCLYVWLAHEIVL